MKTATIIITDEGFLVPSLALADSIATSRLSSLTDVLLFLVDVDRDVRDRLAASDLGKRIDIIAVDFREFGISEEAAFRPSHISKTALGRLAIYNKIPAAYENVIYMDGDMQILGDAAGLFTYEVPPGQIAACVEHFILFGQDAALRPSWLNQYLGSIRLSSPDQYFNSGLLAFRRCTWEDLGAKALKFFNDHSEICRHHDQTALNAVCRGQWQPLSPAYNYQSFYVPVGHKVPLEPKIAHFTSAPKPWQSSKSLWPIRHALPYQELLTTFPFLRRYMNHVAAPSLLDRIGLRQLRILRRRILDRQQIASRGKAFNAYLARTDFVLR